MIVKAAKLDKSIKSSFKRLTEYITQEQVQSDINIRNVGVWIEPDDIYDIDDLDLFIEDIESVQSMSNAKSDKTYHLIVSFGAEERPDIETLKNINNELIDSLGYSKHQRLTVIHDDTDNLHMHIAINKINPEKYTIHEPFRDYKILSEKAMELENKYNLNQTHSNEKTKDNICYVANDIDSRATQISFKSYVENIDLSDCKSWQDFHDKLKENGVEYRKYGNGAVFKDLIDDKINIKASAVQREYSLNSLEKKYGIFEPSQSLNNIQNSYQRYQDLSLKKQYDLIDTSRKIKSKQEKQVVKNEYMDAAKYSGDIIDNLSRMAGGSELDRILIKMNKRAMAKAKLEKLREERQKEIKKINDKYKYYNYDVWLQQQALTNEKAELALKNIKESRINYIKGDFKGLKNSALKITKNGTYILNNKLKATNISIFLTPKYNNMKKAVEILKDNNIKPDTLNGTDEFKAKIIDIIAANDLDITFQDNNINQKISAAKILKQDNLISYVNERNSKIISFAKFDGKEQEYIYQGYFKYNDKFLLKFKSNTSNTVYIKEPIKEDYILLKQYKKGDTVYVNTPIKDSYDIECFVNEKEKTRITFKELSSPDNFYKRISTKEHNGQKLYLYKKDNDNSIYVSTTYHIKEKEQNKENINNKNKGLER